MYGFMFTAHTPLFSVYLAKPKILTYQRFDSKDLYIFVIAISQLSTNSMQPSMQGLWISSKTNTDNQSVKIKRFVPKVALFFIGNDAKYITLLCRNKYYLLCGLNILYPNDIPPLTGISSTEPLNGSGLRQCS